MPCNFILIDSITCESMVELMHYGGDNSDGQSLWELQTLSGKRIAEGEKGLLLITSETKEIIEEKYSEGSIPMSLGCLLGACREIDIHSKDEVDSILKAASWLAWKEEEFCILTGNSLLRSKASSNFKTFDLSEIQDLISNL